MQNNITVVIHTFNEEHNIEECIQSAQLLTDKIVVVDMESTDATVEKVKKMGITVHTFPFSYYVEPARAFGIEKAQTDWVFIIDADERVTPEVAAEIKQVISITPMNNKSHNETFQTNSREEVQTDKNFQLTNSTNYKLQTINSPTHYKVPRKNIFGRVKWLEHGGWWPDAQMRLINKRFFQQWPTRIHSTPEIEGTMGYLTQPFLHHFHGDIEKMVEKTIIYENIESDLLFKANRPVSTPIFFRKFLGELFRRLFKHQGFKDGHIGIIESVYQAFSKTITYIYLYEKKKSSTV